MPRSCVDGCRANPGVPLQGTSGGHRRQASSAVPSLFLIEICQSLLNQPALFSCANIPSNLLFLRRFFGRAEVECGDPACTLPTSITRVVFWRAKGACQCSLGQRPRFCRGEDMGGLKARSNGSGLQPSFPSGFCFPADAGRCPRLELFRAVGASDLDATKIRVRRRVLHFIRIGKCSRCLSC